MNTEYLKDSVGRYLCQALCEVAKRRPERPIEFLAYYLISLYERDLQLQRSEKMEVELEEKEEESEEDKIISQMFRERLSIAFPRDRVGSLAETPSSADISRMFKERLSIAFPRDRVGSLADTSSSADISRMFRERLSIAFPRGEGVSPAPMTPSSSIFLNDEESEDGDKEEDYDRMKMPDVSARKLSIFAEKPVTEEELKETGATDPFLARRMTNVFDENVSPIGNQQL